VAIIAISNHAGPTRKLYSKEIVTHDGTHRYDGSVSHDGIVRKEVENINAYLVGAPNVTVQKASKPLIGCAEMNFGNKPVDGGHLLLNGAEVNALKLTPKQHARFIRRIYGSAEFICGSSVKKWVSVILPMFNTQSS